MEVSTLSNNIDYYYEYDAKRGSQKITYLNDYEIAKRYIAERCFDLSDKVAAKVGDTVMIRLNKGEYIGIKSNPSLTQVNNELLKKDFNERYEVSLKLAQFHGWLEILNPKTGFVTNIGASVDPLGSWMDAEFYVRCDDGYSRKYFKPESSFESNINKYLNYNKGLLKVTFEVDKVGLEKIKDQIKYEIINNPPGNECYSLLMNNCLHFANRVLNKGLGTKDISFIEFPNADLIDLADQGLGKMFLEHYTYHVIPNNLDYLGLHLEKIFVNRTSIGMQFNSMYNKLYDFFFNSELNNGILNYHFLDKQDQYPNLAKIACSVNNYQFLAALLERGLNVIEQDFEGQTTLNNFLLATKLSDEKYDLLCKMCSDLPHVNFADYHNEYTPLSCAIKIGDYLAMKILIEEFGADYNYVNSVGENLAHIAADIEKPSADCVKYLFELNPELFFVHCGNRQLPFYREEVYSILQNESQLKPPLTHDEAYNKILHVEIIDELFKNIEQCYEI